MKEDALASYAEYALLNFKVLPSTFANMNIREQAFIIACIDNEIEVKKKALKSTR